MNIEIKFDANNAAFEDSFVDELNSVILNAKNAILDAKSRDGDDSFRYSLRDSNGNKVGHVEVNLA
jgi:hypothetical protein